ncbi:hypothetical protein BSR29_02045 [Boudabousia liubingyangii]|uniref:THUMP-like domain-containing protein n=1 Tax=Boudabousia liubingyangii TaxID=1921764 RepID=A0A1Q5PQB3_9ACTO|nr:class I SAM-dependent methyltransferase [Boudabousia liubingyangii]OKL49754.1 hypothetical protein BSR29_02045 [Boudabousia liubingyangii]
MSEPVILSPEAQELLGQLGDFSPENTLQIAQKWRSAGYEAPVVASVMTQVELRRKAQAKFGPQAQNLYFTIDGLEQASRSLIANWHAQQWRQAGITHVADLGCGVGTESLANAQHGLKVEAFEIDPETAALTKANLAPYPEATVHNTDLFEVAKLVPRPQGLFADPARRTNGKRLIHPDQWLPPLPQLLSLREVSPNLMIKVAPGLAREHFPADSHVAYLSVAGSLVEACILTGKLAELQGGPGRSAVILTSDHTYRFMDSDCRNPQAEPVHLDRVHQAAPGDYLFEPDPALVRSGTLASFCEDYGLSLLDEHLAYLVLPAGQEIPSDPAFKASIQGFKVLEVQALKPKALKQRVTALGWDQVDILVRGVQVVPEQLRTQLGLGGKKKGKAAKRKTAQRGHESAHQHGAIICARVGEDHLAFLCEPLG